MENLTTQRVRRNSAENVEKKFFTAKRAKKNVRALLVIAFATDLADHYSQMANYMRLNGMIPPSSLPPSKS